MPWLRPTQNWVTPGGGGSTAFVAGIKTITFADSPYTVEAGDYRLLVDCALGAVTVNMPAIGATPGRELGVKKIDATANAVTIDGDGAETIDGGATALLNLQYQAIDMQDGGTEWNIVG